MRAEKTTDLTVLNGHRGLLRMRKKRLIGLLSILAMVVVAAASPRGQSAPVDEIVPPSNLLLDGIPKISSALAKAVGQYRSSYGYPLAGWDPSKRELWLKTLASTGTWLSHLDAPGGIQKPLLSIPVGGIYDVYYQPQGKYLVYNKDSAGNESFQFYIYDIAARESRLLTDGKSRNTEPVWSNAGDRIVYSSSPPNGKGVDLSLVNPFNPRTKRVIAHGQGHYLRAFDWSLDNHIVAFCDYASNTVGTLWTINIATGRRALISVKSNGNGDYYESPQFSKDDRALYVITDRDSEYRRLALIDLTTRSYKYLSAHINWDVEDFKLSPDGKTVAFVTNEDGVSRLHLFDSAACKETSLPGLPDGVISDLKWHNNSVDLAFNLKSPQTPNDVYSVNIKTGKIDCWSKAVLGQVNLESLPRPEIIHWRSFDGRVISGILYRPRTPFSGRRPVIIDVHGGPEEQYRPVFGYDDNYFVNELGVVKIFPNVRGSTGYGKTFANLDNGLHREDATRDVGALLDWIRTQQRELDPDRVMIQGSSYGGYAALSAAARYADQIRAAASDSGPSNLVTFVEGTAAWRRDVRRPEFGDERNPKTRAFLEKIAPLNNVSKIKTPLLIIQGGNDPRVPVGEARRLVSALKKRSVPVWYLLAKDEGHEWINQNNWDFRIYAMALFVRKYLID